MPSIEEWKKRRPAFALCLIGAQGSGKTEQGCGFPKVYYVGTDPTGLDTVLYQERTAKLVNNLVHIEVLNGLPLDEIFANDESSLSSIYGNIAYATELAAQGKVKTIFLDNLTYLIDLMWSKIDAEVKDKRQAFGQLKTFANDLMLSRLLPLATRNGINIVTAMHLQRESKESVEGVENFRTGSSERVKAEIGSSKRHVHLDSDLSPMILGSFRQNVGGMPSALIYLNDEIGSEGKLRYIAYTQKQRVASWDTVIEAKNRYGLPPILDLTNASLYATLVATSKKAIAARPEAKTAVATTSTPTGGDSPLSQPALDAQTTRTTQQEMKRS